MTEHQNDVAVPEPGDRGRVGNTAVTFEYEMGNGWYKVRDAEGFRYEVRPHRFEPEG